MFPSQFHWDTLVVLSMLREDGSGLETDESALQWSCSGSSDFSVSCIKESLNKQNFFSFCGNSLSFGSKLFY